MNRLENFQQKEQQFGLSVQQNITGDLFSLNKCLNSVAVGPHSPKMNLLVYFFLDAQLERPDLWSVKWRTTILIAVENDPQPSENTVNQLKVRVMHKYFPKVFSTFLSAIGFKRAHQENELQRTKAPITAFVQRFLLSGCFSCFLFVLCPVHGKNVKRDPHIACSFFFFVGNK